MNIFKSIYYWFVNRKDAILYDDLKGHYPYFLMELMRETGWDCPKRLRQFEGFKFSYKTDKEKIYYDLNIPGWSGSGLVYLKVKKRISYFDGSADSVMTDYYDDFLFGKGVFNHKGYKIKNKRDAEKALIGIDPYFASHIRETKLKKLLDKKL